MASTTSSYSLLLRRPKSWSKQPDKSQASRTRRNVKIGTGRSSSFGIFAEVQDANKGQKKAPPGVDTRIHWENEDEGWVGATGTNSTTPTPEQLRAEAEKDFLGSKFSDLLNSSDSHYQFLGVSAAADLEEIKAAYRRLSKEYHPDTTSLPLRAASDKFMKLREIYNVLSDDESRRFYDWSLAQEAASKQAEKMRRKLEDPYQQDIDNYEPVPDLVDRLGGKNLALSDQAMSALTVDIAIIIFSICCIIYVIYFKAPDY